MTSPAPASQPTPTEADRAQAREIVVPGRDAFDWSCTGPNLRGIVDRVAQALADQRAELVARYEAVARKLDDWSGINRLLMNSPEMPPEGRTYHDGLREAQRLAAERIRQVGQ